jgi:uncharacterized C2H2 Zn-finger protein
MIRVSLTALVFIYLAVFLAVIFFVWITRNLRRIRREKEDLRHRLRCTLCGFEFEDRSSELLARCPRCASLNERFPFRSL